jgi:hypothetical protein
MEGLSAIENDGSKRANGVPSMLPLIPKETNESRAQRIARRAN